MVTAEVFRRWEIGSFGTGPSSNEPGCFSSHLDRYIQQLTEFLYSYSDL